MEVKMLSTLILLSAVVFAKGKMSNELKVQKNYIVSNEFGERLCNNLLAEIVFIGGAK